MGRCGNFTLLVIKLLLDWHVAVITHQKKILFPSQNEWVSRQQCNGELSVDVRVCSNNTALGACWGNNWKITQRKKKRLVVVVDYFAEVYLGLLSGEHMVALKLLYWVLKYLSQGHDRMFPVRAPTSNSYVMKPLDGHHNTHLHCFVEASKNK